jgi:hypothetical protein
MRFRSTAVVCFLGSLLQAQSQGTDSPGLQLNPAAAAPAAPPFVVCPAGAPLGALDLQVQAGDQRLPFRTINRLSEGDTLLYAPVLRGKEKRPGEIALVLVPQKREPGQEDIIVTDPKPADKPYQWKMTRTISIAALVYGPAGLNRKNVAKLLSQDEVLVAQLADYADKTAEAQQLVATLSNSESSTASVNAALNGFASQYGFAVQIDRNAPVAAQAGTVFASMNPQLAAYNPLASSTAQRVGQTASLATMAGALFFGSPVGLAAGGTAMLLDLRSIAFPDTQFRASFAQPLTGSVSGLNLCGQQGPLPPHTRVAYLWASRVPNIPAPSILIGEPSFIPTTQKTPVSVDVSEPGWKYLDRVRQWALVNDQQKTTPVPVVKLGNQKMLELDLTNLNLPPGDYGLTGLWDWTTMKATGAVHVLPVSDFNQAHLDPASQDRLLAASGNTSVRVTGSDFEFTTKVELQKLNDEFATPEPVRFLLPKGLRQGPQDHLDVQIATQSLVPGAYELLITQQDGKRHPVEFKVLPNPPKIDNLPIIVNQGVATQHFVLKGERLGQITRLEASGAILNLSPPAPNQAERSLTAELKSSPQPGTRLTVKAYLQDRSEPLTLPNALEITGPLPVIPSAKLSLPTGLAIGIRSDEFPAGYTLNALLDVKNMERTSVLRLGCADGVGEQASLHVGGQTAHWSLQQLSPDQLFLAFDSSALPAGCSLQAVIDNPREGSSQPFTLAHILRIPKIDSFAVSQDQPHNGLRQYRLTGENLEMIQKLGWTESDPVDVSSLPMPLPGPGLKQSVELNLPDPPKPDATLWVWLRGDQQGRAATIKAPPLPSPAPPVAPAASLPLTSFPPATDTPAPTTVAAPPEQQKKREK